MIVLPNELNSIFCKILYESNIEYSLGSCSLDNLLENLKNNKTAILPNLIEKESDKISEIFIKLNLKKLLEYNGTNDLFKHFLMSITFVSEKNAQLYHCQDIDYIDSKVEEVKKKLFSCDLEINNKMITPIIKNKTYTVLIPCFRKSNIEDTILSCINQTLVPNKIYVSLLDKDSYLMKDKLEGLSDKVKCFCSKRQGVASDRNFLVDKVETTHFINLDAGDKLKENFIERDNEIDADIIIHNYTEKTPKIKYASCFQPTITVNTEYFKNIGKWDEDFNIGGEETNLFLRMINCGKIVIRPGGVLFSNREIGMFSVSQMNKCYWKLFSKDYNIPLDIKIKELENFWS